MRYGAVITAAGISSRMGRFKPLLPIGGETIISRMVRLMRQAGASPILIITGYQADKLEGALAAPDVVFVRNENFAATKMFDSVKLGLSRMIGICDRVIFSPGDVPLVLDDTLGNIMAQEGLFVRPVCGGRFGHPVIIDASIIPGLLIDGGEAGLRGAVERMGVPITNLPVDDEGSIMDVDTREEYERLLRYCESATGERIPLRLTANVSLEAGGTVFDATGAIFLDLIRETGSMNAACKAMRMPYARGLSMINSLEGAMGFPVISRASGGSGGGGSSLTEEGRQLLLAYEEMRGEIEGCADKIFMEKMPFFSGRKS